MDDRYAPEKLAKLPAWARNHIANLTRDLAEAEQMLKAVSHEDVSDFREGIGVSLRYSISSGFRWVKTDYDTAEVAGVSITADRNGGVRVHAMRPITITPQAANAVIVTPETTR